MLIYSTYRRYHSVYGLLNVHSPDGRHLRSEQERHDLLNIERRWDDRLASLRETHSYQISLISLVTGTQTTCLTKAKRNRSPSA